jgi:hypothetical protein
MTEKTHLIAGGCHCGNIELAYASPLPPAELRVRSCDCSFCTKQGAYYTSHPEGRLEVVITDRERFKSYRFATLTADAWFCTRCGTFVLMTSEIENRLFAVLNVNCLNDLHFNRLTVPSLSLSEDSAEQRLSRRQKAWIGSVSFRDKTDG